MIELLQDGGVLSIFVSGLSYTTARLAGKSRVSSESHDQVVSCPRAQDLTLGEPLDNLVSLLKLSILGLLEYP